MPGLSPSPATRYRRSPALVMYWQDETLVCFDAAHAKRLRLSPDLVSTLSHLCRWMSAEDLAAAAPDLGPAALVRRLLKRLVAVGLAEQEGSPPWTWREWSPEAAFFHFGTRGGTFPDDARDYDVTLRAKALLNPPPPATKSMPGARRALPPAADLGPLSAALLGRRTWRNFGAAPVALADLSTLLKLTWGVQKWGAVRGQGRVALKTSPSGGARHSIEAYVLARHVRGLKAGAYHYDAATNELVDLRERITKARLTRLLAKQFYYGPAGAAIVMTAVFARAMWRYPYSKSYRSVLTEAGHLGQTFCVTATALGLAPFCTMAFHDREVEGVLGVDGQGECAIYVVGVGTRSARHAAQPGHLTERGRA
jgi:SagB-type dehydrogenase family enzyme